MLAYAPRSTRAQRRASPLVLGAIIAAHAGALALVMSARMALPDPIHRTPTIVEAIPLPPPPDPPRAADPAPRPPLSSSIDQHPAIVPLPLPDLVGAEPQVVPPGPGPLAGDTSLVPLPLPLPPTPAPVRVGPRFTTAPSAIQPPYPLAKRRAEEEAVLKLRLSIDARGRVVAVEPVGAADPIFLDAARRHILARWRYAPATEDGKAVPSDTVITLRFELRDG